MARTMTRLLLSAAFTLLTCCSPALAVVIYQDTFDGDGSAGLNGAAPNVAIIPATWTSGTNLLNNGVQDGTGAFTALLPFTPEQGGVYTLTASFNPSGSGLNWLAAGFAQRVAALEGGWNATSGSQPALWALSRRAGATGTDTSFLGLPGATTAGSLAAPTLSATSLIITLDTTAPDWQVTWDFNGDGVDRMETILVANRPNINYVGFSSNDAAGTSTINSFTLEGPAPPLSWIVNGGGSFNTAANWSGNAVPTTIAVFGSVLTAPNAPAVVTLDSPISLNEIRFADADQYQLAGPGTLTLTGAATVNVSAGTHVISATIDGTDGLNKTGGGALILSGTNTYTGDANVTAGALRAFSVGSITGDVDVAAGTSFGFQGDGLGGGYDGIFSGVISGAGTVVTSATLTTETVTFNTAHTYAGTTTVAGGTLEVAPGGTLGTADGTVATRTIVQGNLDDGTLALTGGVTLTNELLSIAARQGVAIEVPHLTSNGNNIWTGNIIGGTGGNQFNFESTAGELTLAGTISGPDSGGQRTFSFSGAGDTTITGRITDFVVDAVGVIGVTNTIDNIAVVKKGTGTLTIATAETSDDNYHQGRTIIEAGTLAVTAASELRSSTIEISQGATFDLANFSQPTYSLQIDQVSNIPQALSGGGTIELGSTSLVIFGDNSITPGDNGVGTLKINGDVSFNSVAVGGVLSYELGDTLTATVDNTVNDLISVDGDVTTTGPIAMVVEVKPTTGDLAVGNYRLIAHTGVTTNFSGTTASIVDAGGNPLNTRHSVSVNGNTNGQVNLVVADPEANLVWAGTGGNSTWDVATTTPWQGGEQFFDLDDTEFGAGGNKTVTIADSVYQGDVSFTSASTYTFDGSGGLVGTGRVDVNAGTARFTNTGNNYAGVTTVASSARLEMNTGTTGNMVVDGTLSVGSDGVATGGAQTFYSDDFNGLGGAPLNGTTPDTSFGGNSWVAASFFEDNGGTITGTAGGSATLGFTPTDGSTYVIETSISDISGDNDWLALGFVNGQSTATNSGSRFITGTVEGVAWAFYRGDASVDPNVAHSGDPSLPTNGGLASAANWSVDANTSGNDQDVTIRITLDTTGGAGNWTATWEANTGSGFNVIRNTEGLLSEAINAVGIASSNSAANGIVGTFDSFSLTGVEPVDARLAGQTLTVNGDLAMSAGATLELEFAQVGQDFVSVTGAASLNGTIDVTKLGSFTPVNGQQYTLLTAAGGITDLGVTFDLPTNFTASIVDTTDLVITFAAGFAGDFNGDGFVDAADYTVWRDNLGGLEADAFAAGSGSGNTIIDADDYTLWRANFGNVAPASGSLADVGQGAVPEPSTLALAGLGLLAAVAIRRR